MCKNIYVISSLKNLPVTGASISIIVLSERRRAAPSLTIRSAADSSILPSRIKCCLSTSGRGRPVRVSKTSAIVSLRDGGNGTPVKNKREEKKINFFCSPNFYKVVKNKKCIR